MMPPSLTLDGFREMTTADASVLLGRPLTDAERRITLHTTDTMHAAMHNVIAENKRLAALVARYEQSDDGRGNEMAVVA